jgi:hypothetical protein
VKFGVVTEERVKDFFIDAQNNIFAVQPNGRVLKITNGKVSVLSDAPFGNLHAASFSFDGKRAFVVFGEQNSQQASVFTFSSASWQPLPASVQNPAWAPDSQKLVFFSVGSEFSNLSTLDFSLGTPIPQSLLRMHVKDALLEWPRPGRIVIADKGGSYFKSSVLLYDTKAGSLSAILSDQEGLAAIWARDTDRGLVFSGGPTTRGNRLMLTDFSGKTVPLSLTTLPSKCAFGSETSTIPVSAASPSSSKPVAPPVKQVQKAYLVCGVPRSFGGINQGRFLDLYEERGFYTADDFYKIDLETGNIGVLFNDPAYELDATNLKILGGRVFFVNRYDERLYAISLK